MMSFSKKIKTEYKCAIENLQFHTLAELQYHLQHDCIQKMIYFNFEKHKKCDCLDVLLKHSIL